MLVEGSSLRTISRVTGASRNTINKLLCDAGKASLKYQDETLTNLSCKRIQCDEIWSFVYAKDKNVPEDMKDAGDIWTWVAIDADSKLVPCWYVGGRRIADAMAFMEDLAPRLPNRVQITTDGHRPYMNAIEEWFGDDVDYGRLIKIYGPYNDDKNQRRYSAGELVRTEKQAYKGDPDFKNIATSYVERQNLTMRMSMRRFTRLTNGFSKKVENHMHAISLHFMYYNFCRVHNTLKMTPAMAAGIAESVYEIEFIVDLIDQLYGQPKKRGPYKKRISK